MHAAVGGHRNAGHVEFAIEGGDAGLVGAGGVNSGIFQMMVGRMLQGDLGGLKFAIDNGRKDLRYFTHLTESLPTSSYLAEAAHQSFVVASNLGHGEAFIASLFKAQEQLNAVNIVPPSAAP